MVKTLSYNAMLD
ncbi:protein of unknown function [uncultured Sphingopyxis sp.]|uniref:Uncharacterized protein n=1 Tax=uncultured Sphingopyxis sp. TaxID=310581 RepID=A0A1Y5PT83_9SPHN|nr:protein of unknown function [uncultured Sphingopyxis sp.]